MLLVSSCWTIMFYTDVAIRFPFVYEMCEPGFVSCLASTYFSLVPNPCTLPRGWGLDYSHPAAIYQQGWFCEGWVSYILCEPLDLVMYPGLLRSVEVTSWSQQYVLKNNLLLSLLVSPSDWKLGEAKNDIDVVIWLPSLNAYMFERKDSIDVLIYIYKKHFYTGSNRQLFWGTFYTHCASKLMRSSKLSLISVYFYDYTNHPMKSIKSGKAEYPQPGGKSKNPLS